MKKVFVTGVTGKSGLYFLDEIVKNSDDSFSFTFLVKTREKSDYILSKYPKAYICLGSYDDKELLQQEFSKG